MQREDVYREIKEILVEILSLEIDPEEIGDDEILFEGQLGLDSVAAIEILSEIEDRFDIEVEDEEIDLDMFRTVRSLAEVILEGASE